MGCMAHVDESSLTWQLVKPLNCQPNSLQNWPRPFCGPNFNPRHKIPKRDHKNCSAKPLSAQRRGAEENLTSHTTLKLHIRNCQIGHRAPGSLVTLRVPLLGPNSVLPWLRLRLGALSSPRANRALSVNSAGARGSPTPSSASLEGNLAPSSAELGKQSQGPKQELLQAFEWVSGAGGGASLLVYAFALPFMTVSKEFICWVQWLTTETNYRKRNTDNGQYPIFRSVDFINFEKLGSTQ